MVGDRLDNDLRPAQSLGMATAWVRWARRADKGWAPVEPEPTAYLEAQERIATDRARRADAPGPALIVDDLARLADALVLPESGVL